jgi:hypothetical protein
VFSFFLIYWGHFATPRAHKWGLLLTIPLTPQVAADEVDEWVAIGAAPRMHETLRRSPAETNGPQTVLIYQQVGSIRYLDAAGFPGRTVGVPDGKAVSQRWLILANSIS